MQLSTIGTLLIATTVGAAILAGLTVTGSPVTARAEKRDDVRLADLRKLSQAVTCMADLSGALPEVLARHETCAPQLPMSGPTGKSRYRYEKRSDSRFRLCAEFERADRVTQNDLRNAAWDKSSGCFTISHRIGT